MSIISRKKRDNKANVNRGLLNFKAGLVDFTSKKWYNNSRKEPEASMNIGENIYKYRTANNMSQTDLANALEVSRQSVSKWENNSAVPDLERIIKMSKLFDVTLDELVYGEKPTPPAPPAPPSDATPQLTLNVKSKTVAGCFMLIFGMVFFLLSIFWGDHLWFGEEIGELVSITIVLISLSLIATDNFRVFAVCAVIYTLYSVVCFGILPVTSLANYIFTFATSWIILIWFLVWGTHASAEGEEEKNA